MRIVHPLQTMRTTVAADQHENRPAVVLQGSWLTGARLAFVVFASVAIWLTVMSSVDSVRDANGYWLAAIGDSGDAQTAVANGGTDLFTFIALGAIEFVRILVFFTVASLLVWRSREVIAFVVAALPNGRVGSEFPTQPLRHDVDPSHTCYARTDCDILFPVPATGHLLRLPGWSLHTALDDPPRVIPGRLAGVDLLCRTRAWIPKRLVCARRPIAADCLGGLRADLSLPTNFGTGSETAGEVVHHRLGSTSGHLRGGQHRTRSDRRIQ